MGLPLKLSEITSRERRVLSEGWISGVSSFPDSGSRRKHPENYRLVEGKTAKGLVYHYVEGVETPPTGALETKEVPVTFERTRRGFSGKRVNTRTTWDKPALDTWPLEEYLEILANENGDAFLEQAKLFRPKGDGIEKFGLTFYGNRGSLHTGSFELEFDRNGKFDCVASEGFYRDKFGVDVRKRLDIEATIYNIMLNVPLRTATKISDVVSYRE